MTLRATILSDIDIINDVDDFAISAAYTPYGGSASTITVMFYSDGIVADPYTGMVKGGGPQAVAKTTDVPSAGHKDILVISLVTYEVTKADPLPDVFGKTILHLNKTS